MRLPGDAQISWRKITGYLLALRAEDDKSQFLERGGYSLDTAAELVRDIRALLDAEAVFVESTDYGDKYEIRGKLIGPNGRPLAVVTIWMIERNGTTKFITLYPNK